MSALHTCDDSSNSAPGVAAVNALVAQIASAARDARTIAFYEAGLGLVIHDDHKWRVRNGLLQAGRMAAELMGDPHANEKMKASLGLLMSDVSLLAASPVFAKGQQPVGKSDYEIVFQRLGAVEQVQETLCAKMVEMGAEGVVAARAPGEAARALKVLFGGNSKDEFSAAREQYERPRG